MPMLFHIRIFESKHLQGCQVVLYSQLRLIYAKLIYDDIEIHFDVPSVKSIETMAQSKLWMFSPFHSIVIFPAPYVKVYQRAR